MPLRRSERELHRNSAQVSVIAKSTLDVSLPAPPHTRSHARMDQLLRGMKLHLPNGQWLVGTSSLPQPSLDEWHPLSSDPSHVCEWVPIDLIRSRSAHRACAGCVTAPTSQHSHDPRRLRRDPWRSRTVGETRKGICHLHARQLEDKAAPLPSNKSSHTPSVSLASE